MIVGQQNVTGMQIGKKESGDEDLMEVGLEDGFGQTRAVDVEKGNGVESSYSRPLYEVFVLKTH